MGFPLQPPSFSEPLNGRLHPSQQYGTFSLVVGVASQGEPPDLLPLLAGPC